MTDVPKPDARLPTLAGGWELQAGRHVELWVPKAPDALFDPDTEVDRRDYHNAMPYWAWVWDAAEPCVEGLLERGVGGRILEVGAGLGAVGLALAAKLETPVTLSDYDPVAIAAMEVNAERNGLRHARVWRLDWRELVAAPEERFDVIVGCEVIYDPGSHEALIDALERYLEPGIGRAHLFDPGRAPARQFVRRAEKRGFNVQVERLDGSIAPLAAGEARWLRLGLPDSPSLGRAEP